MKPLLSILVLALVFLSKNAAIGQTVKVGLEPFPPLITETAGGFTVRLLRVVEQRSDLHFDITIMPYSQAKNQLQLKQLDLIGHTPKGLEDSAFFEYAQELEWDVPTSADIFVKNKDYLNLALIRAPESTLVIGSPFGNANFFGNMLEIPRERFREGRLNGLLQMLDRGRIDLFVFERASTMTTIQQLELSEIHYETIGFIPAGLATRRDDDGAALKLKLDQIIKTIDVNQIYGSYLPFMSMPEKGTVQFSH